MEIVIKYPENLLRKQDNS